MKVVPLYYQEVPRSHEIEKAVPIAAFVTLRVPDSTLECSMSRHRAKTIASFAPEDRFAILGRLVLGSRIWAIGFLVTAGGPIFDFISRPDMQNYNIIQSPRSEYELASS